jgi:hypothetical protein
MTQPVKASQPVKPVGSKPPGKGPKTFDEMGVQAGKEQGDCVSLCLVFYVEAGNGANNECRLLCDLVNLVKTFDGDRT